MLNKKLDKILPQVQKPGTLRRRRTEFALLKIKRTWTCALRSVFPDTYEIGMSHLGMKILYSARLTSGR